MEGQHPSKFLHAIGFQLPQTLKVTLEDLGCTAAELTVPIYPAADVGHPTRCSSPHGIPWLILSYTALQDSSLSPLSIHPSGSGASNYIVTYLLKTASSENFSCCLALETLLALMLFVVFQMNTLH